MTIQEILKSVGYPEQTLVLDFESYFTQAYSLKKMSTIEYIKHPMFALTGLAVKVNNDPAAFNPPPDYSVPDTLNYHTIIVKNAKFDITILKEKWGFVPKHIIDIEDLIRHWDSREKVALEKIVKVFKLPAKGDTKQFIGLHWEEMDDTKRSALALYACNDAELEYQLLEILLPKLSNPKIELALARHTLDLYLREKIEFDFNRAVELKGEMDIELGEIVKQSGHTVKEISGDNSFFALLKAALGDEPVPMKQGKNKLIPALAQKDDGCKYLLTHSKEEVRVLMETRQAVSSWPLHIKRINNMTDQAIACGGKIKIPLKYYGGHTGRWSGTEAINVQNLGGKGRTGKGIDPLISGMRSMLRAPEGQKFIIVDSAQIEARILAWLAGQEDLLDGFRKGQDIYSEFASTLFKHTVRKPRVGDSPDITRQLSIWRGFGKDAILGCGYGMGADKFYERCRENPDLRPLFDSGEYNLAFIQKLIDTYRNTYSKIPTWWYELEKWFKMCIKFPQHYTVCARGNPVEIYLWNDNNTINLQLPSGRILYYCNVRIDSNGTICDRYGKLWGGSLTENIVQAIARDLLGYWILQFEENYLTVALHAHDEIVALSPEGCEKYNLERAITYMKSAPDWTNGLPLDAEGEISDVYKK